MCIPGYRVKLLLKPRSCILYAYNSRITTLILYLHSNRLLRLNRGILLFVVNSRFFSLCQNSFSLFGIGDFFLSYELLFSGYFGFRRSVSRLRSNPMIDRYIIATNSCLIDYLITEGRKPRI